LSHAAIRRPWQRADRQLTLRVRLTPRASSDRIDGVQVLSDGSPVLAARVRALPEDGAANAALAALVAKTLGVPKGSVRVVSGATARIKEIRVEAEPGRLDGAVAVLEGIAGGS
jgi:uncharacterized protein YggU (UPF0235/DUF167 family)